MNRKQIAAITGVLYYLQDEKRRLLNQVSIMPYSMINRWSMYGRQTIMKLRTRAQLRILGAGMHLPFLNQTTWNNGKLDLPLHRIKNLADSQNRLKTQAQIRKAYILKRQMKHPVETELEARI